MENGNWKLRESELKKQDHKTATYTRTLTKQDGFIPFSTLTKALNNQPLTFEELPEIIKKYALKNNVTMKQLSNEIIYNFFRGLHPWPGVWTKIKIKNQEKRLKIIDLDLLDNKLKLNTLQLEGKKEVDFTTFNKAYGIF